MNTDRVLTAGALSIELKGVDLFDLRWENTQIAQRVYVAVRDAPWNTIPGIIERRDVQQGTDSFHVDFRSRHIYGDIDFVWEGVIEGASDGTLTFRMSGEALSDFEYSKIGFNIHHAIDVYRERAYSAESRDGRSFTGRLPTLIEPQLIRDGFLTAIFDDFAKIEFDLDGQTVEFEFSGDEFEMQDHRNWSDANYKTYGTPLKLGFPFPAHKGENFEQAVRVSPGESPASQAPHAAKMMHLSAAPGGLPEIGHLYESHQAPPLGAPSDTDLSFLMPDFIRVEVDNIKAVAPTLDAAQAAFPGAGIPVELVFLTTAEDAASDAGRLALALRDSNCRVTRVLIFERALGFSATKLATPSELVNSFVKAFRQVPGTVQILSGSEQNFNEINRSRPYYVDLDGIAFALNPQVHASDDVSLMQNAAGIVDITTSARVIYPGAAISVGTVRLIGQDGPYPAGPPAPGDDGPTVDHRQSGLFGAAWAVAFLRSASAAGVEAVTLYPLSGPGNAADSAVSWVIRRLREDPPVAASPILVSDSSNDRLGCMSWSTASGGRTLVANLRDEEEMVRLPIDPRSAKIGLLSDSTATAEAFAAYSPTSPQLQGGATGVDDLATAIPPFGIICVDSILPLTAT